MEKERNMEWKEGQEGTPEQALLRFLYSWYREDWSAAVLYTQKTWRAGESKPAKVLKWQLKDLKLKDLESISKSEISPVVVDMRVVVLVETLGSLRKMKIVVRVIKEKGPYLPSLDGDWGINPLSIRVEWEKLV